MDYRETARLYAHLKAGIRGCMAISAQWLLAISAETGRTCQLDPRTGALSQGLETTVPLRPRLPGAE